VSARVPTRKQFRRLGAIAMPGSIVPSPTRNEWLPLRNHGWTRDIACTLAEHGRAFGGAYVQNWYLPPQQITPNGLRALADAMERYEGEDDRG
jgi:hypothetical protein